MTTASLSDLSGPQRVALYGALFAMAAIDGSIDKDEIAAIYETLELTGLDEADQLRVRGFLVEPPAFEECIVALGSLPEELRFGVLVLLAEVVLADDVVAEEEKEALRLAAGRLGACGEQLEAIMDFVREARRIRERGLDDSAALDALRSAAAGLTGVGVPIAAVYVGGSVVGLSAAGVTSGLAALGFGFGMVPGIGVAVVAGTLTFLAVRKLLRLRRDTRNKTLQAQRERRAQLVLMNLQGTIDLLVQRIADLEEQGEQARRNEAAIAELTNRLRALKSLLAKRAEAPG